MSNVSERDGRESSCREKWSYHQILNDGKACRTKLKMFSLNISSGPASTLSSCSSWAICLAGWSHVSSWGANQRAQRLWASDEFFWLALSDSCPINPTLCFLIWSWYRAQKQMCTEDITGNTTPALTPGQEQLFFHMNIQFHVHFYKITLVSNTSPENVCK